MSPRLAAAVFGALLVSLPALAAEKHAFTAKAFEAAQAAGKSILVEIHAPWCPTCKAQQSALEAVEKNPKFDALQVFRVDFDSQKDALRLFRARSQSTLVTFKGKAETGRSVGDTDAASLGALLDKAL